MIAFFNGQYLAKEDIAVSPDDRGFLFADGLYEVVLCLAGRPFCLRDHLERLEKGAAQLRFSATGFGWLEEVVIELLQKNDLQGSDALVYMQVTRGAAPRSHPFPAGDTPLTVYVSVRPFDQEPARKARQQGVAAITVADQRWARCDIKSLALTANILASQQAAEAGAFEAILVRDGVLIEGSHSNFAGVRNGELVTFPASNLILNGVTRQQTLAVAASLDIPVALQPVFADELQEYDELMLLATTMKITPVVRLDEQVIGDGAPGPVVRRLQQGFRSFEVPGYE